MQRKAIIATILVVALVMVSCVLFACKPTAEAGAYYLTSETTNWATYDADDKVPTAVKLAKSGDTYTLTIKLAKDDAFKIAQVNGKTVYGFDSVFSADTSLVAGADNKISVAVGGTYVLTLDVAANEITYTCTPDAPDPAPKSVEIDNAADFTLTFGDTVTKQLAATVTMDDDTTNKTVTWSSSDNNVATVSAGGLVEAKAGGAAQITAKAGDITSDPVTVTVNGVITLNKSTLTLNVNATEKLVATVLGGAIAVEWTSTNTNVATVSNDGEITAVAAGDATIRLGYRPYANASIRFVDCEVSVNTPVTGISLNNTAMSVPLGSTCTITVAIVPAAATNQNYTAALSEGGDAFVEIATSGTTITVTPKAIGTATLTVKSEDGNYEATCAITVVDEGVVTSSIDKATAHIYKSTGENETAITVSVTNDTIASVAWSSSVTSVATVNSSGATATVAAVEYGTTTVTAQITTTGGESLTETCTVLVAPDNFYMYGGAAGWWNAIDSTIDEYKFTENNGVYTLTVKDMPINSDFRIGDDDNFTSAWKGIRYEHLSSTVKDNTAQGGNDQNGGRNIQITVLGDYTLTIDLTKGKAALAIKCDAVAVTGINISADNSTLTANSETNSATITLTVNPNGATYTAADIEWTCADANVTIAVAADKMSVTITAKDDAEAASVVVSCAVKGKSATANLTVIAAGAQIVEVTEINFSQSAYSFNVNEQWGGTVVATVNADATNQNVTYSTSDSAISIDAATGVITASKIGTYTITATAAGDTTKTTTVQVTIYSAKFYITGDTNSWPTVGQDGKVEADVENYIFSAADATNTIFTLDVALTSGSKFQVMFCETTDWGNVIKGSHLDTSNSNATASGDNIVVGSAGLYRVTIDLTGTTPKITAKRTDDIPTFVAKVLVSGNAVITSENSVSSKNSYAMEFLRTFAENEEFTIAIVNGTDTVLTINNVAKFADNDGLFSDSEGAIKCVAAGKYRFEISYNMSGAYTVTITAIGDDGPVASDAYSILVSGNDNGWTPTAIDGATLFYDSASGEYTFYFAMQHTAWKGFGLVINTKEGTKAFEVWKDGAELLTDFAKTVIYADGVGDMQFRETVTLYFKVVLKTTGVVSIDAATTAFEQPTVE